MADTPTRYYIEYEDDELVARALARAGGNRDLVDLADIFAERDARTLTEARRIARTLPCAVRAAVIRERANLHCEMIEGIIPSYTWDDVTVEEIEW